MAFLSTGKLVLEKINSLEDRTEIICSIVEGHTKALQDLTCVIGDLSAEISKLNESNLHIGRSIEEINMKTKTNLDEFKSAVEDKYKSVVASEKIVQTSIEEIGRILIQNNEEMTKTIKNLDETTDRILNDYQSNLNSVIESIMVSNLIENISDME